MPTQHPPAGVPPSTSTATSPMPNVLNLGGRLTYDDLLRKYDVGDVIGTGAFSEVRRATERATGVQFAVKIIDKAKCRGKESMIMSEVEILKRVKHRNIIRLFELYESPLKIFLIMEVVTGGELFDRIVARGFYTEADAAKLVCEILLGVQYLHTLNVCHRDLKPENLLFFDSSPNARIMISDFGLSKIFSDEQVMKTACGTPGYVAPEVLRREVYTKQVDMWSIGVITYILLCGYPPFYEENNHALFQQIMAGHYEFDSPYWDNISFEAKNFVARLLIVDPKLRMGADEALAHPFITNNCADALALARIGSTGALHGPTMAGTLSPTMGSLARSPLPYEPAMVTAPPVATPNLAPVVVDNLQNYRRRSSAASVKAAAAAAARPAVAPSPLSTPMTAGTPTYHPASPLSSPHATVPRATAALRTGQTGEDSTDSVGTEPSMNPLRPKAEHRDVDDSGLVASIPDVRGKAAAQVAVTNVAAMVNVYNAQYSPTQQSYQQYQQPQSQQQPKYAYTPGLPQSPYGGAVYTPGSHSPTGIGSPHDALGYPHTVHGYAPAVPPAPPVSPSATQTRTVRVLTYSIFMRVPGVKNLNHSDHKNARLHYFIENVLPQYDVVCLQEMYAYGSSRVAKLLQHARQLGFLYHYTSPSKGLLNGCTDGGLVILSRFEIVKQSRLTYKRAVYNCRFVAKGALYTKLKLGEARHLHLFTTNLQKSAGHDLTLNSPEVTVRMTQLAQLRAFVLQCTADRAPNEPILITGDFNLNARPRSGVGSTEEYRQMMRVLAGEWHGVHNARMLEEFVPTDADRTPLPLVDLAYERERLHTVTYGDVQVDAFTGNAVGPAETVLTDKMDQGACHCVDYALWSPAPVSSPGGVVVGTRADGIDVTVQQFAAQGQEFTQVSDHYGIEVMLKVLP